MAASPTKASTLVKGALVALQVLDPNETPDASQGQQGLASLNQMIGQWAIQGLTVPSISRNTFSMTSGKGSTSNPYTVGVGGNLNITRPPDLLGLATYLTSVTPVVEIGRTLLTPEQWAGISVKNLTGTLFTAGFYNPTPNLNLGQLYLWPVPDNTTYTLVLYIAESLAEFDNLTDDYYVADGYVSALKWQLALAIADDHGRTPSPNLERNAARAFGNIKRQNMTLTDMGNDFAAIGSNAPAYDITLGNL